jgi:hypothetical protein
MSGRCVFLDNIFLLRVFQNPHRHSVAGKESHFFLTFKRGDPSDLRPQDDTKR